MVQPLFLLKIGCINWIWRLSNTVSISPSWDYWIQPESHRGWRITKLYTLLGILEKRFGLNWDSPSKYPKPDNARNLSKKVVSLKTLEFLYHQCLRHTLLCSRISYHRHIGMKQHHGRDCSNLNINLGPQSIQATTNVNNDSDYGELCIPHTAWWAVDRAHQPKSWCGVSRQALQYMQPFAQTSCPPLYNECSTSCSQTCGRGEEVGASVSAAQLDGVRACWLDVDAYGLNSREDGDVGWG